MIGVFYCAFCLFVSEFYTNRFEAFVLEVRAPLAQYKSLDVKDNERQRHLQAWLHYKLQDSYTKASSQSKHVKWRYSICTVRYGEVKVCKLMFGTLYGIKEKKNA